MATSLVNGHRDWSLERDVEGHREYKLKLLVRSATTDGPAAVLQTPGLPLPGAFWIVDNDIDLWAWCRPNVSIRRHPGYLEGEPGTFWTAEFTFSTRPPDFQRQRCNDTTIEDPLLEPAKISGDDENYQEEAAYDRFGRPIVSSSHEQLRGQQVEFDKSKGTITIEQNVATLYQAAILPSLMRDTVNKYIIWGFSRRCVKLSKCPWEKRYYGTCFAYYNRKLIFKTDSETFDRDLLDEGTKVLHGKWTDTSGDGKWELLNINGASPNPANPQHFDLFTDRNGNPCRVVLDGSGRPADTFIQSDAVYVSLVLGNTGIPLSTTSSWLLLVGPLGPSPWDANTDYARGNVVSYVSDGTAYTFIALQNNLNDAPTLTSTNWRNLPNGLNNAGTYDANETYVTGQYVRPQGLRSGVGSVHVEKYPESDFLLLGVPTIF